MSVKGKGWEGLTPQRWMLLFHRRAKTEWINRWLPGRWKHVSALGYFAETQCWVWYTFNLRQTWIVAWPSTRDDLLVRVLGQADVLSIAPNRDAARPVLAAWTCVGAMKHLIGLRCGALRPDTLWRDCLAAGAKVVNDD